MIIFDLINITIEYMYNLKDVIHMYHLSKEYEDNIIISNLMILPFEQLFKLDQSIINQNKYHRIKKLYVSNNKKVVNISHLKFIEELDCGYDSAIHQDDIMLFKNLKVLIATNNKNIYDVNHMKKLEELHCDGMFVGIKQSGIKDLTNLKILNVKYNPNIHDINHMANLEYLDCSGEICNITSDSLIKLKKLKKLEYVNNHKIKYSKYLNHLIIPTMNDIYFFHDGCPY